MGDRALPSFLFITFVFRSVLLLERCTRCRAQPRAKNKPKPQIHPRQQQTLICIAFRGAAPTAGGQDPALQFVGTCYHPSTRFGDGANLRVTHTQPTNPATRYAPKKRTQEKYQEVPLSSSVPGTHHSSHISPAWTQGFGKLRPVKQVLCPALRSSPSIPT